jgi:hypothetical protein
VPGTVPHAGSTARSLGCGIPRRDQLLQAVESSQPFATWLLGLPDRPAQALFPLIAPLLPSRYHQVFVEAYPDFRRQLSAP